MAGVRGMEGKRDANVVSWVEAAAEPIHGAQDSPSPQPGLAPSVSDAEAEKPGLGGDSKPDKPPSASSEVRWGCECAEETNQCGSGVPRGVQVPGGDSI